MWADTPDDWEKIYFGDVLAKKASRESVKANQRYDLLGVRWYGKGPFLRESRIGDEQSAAHLFKASFGDIIYNKLFAWKGSFGVVNAELAGCYVSNEFPLFALNLDRVSAEYMALLLRSPRLADRANVVSTGTTSISRNRLDQKDFLKFPIALPSYAEQLAIVETLQAQSDAIANSTQSIGAFARAKFAVLRKLLTRGVRGEAVSMQGLPERWVLGRVAEGVERIPSDWKLVRLTSVAQLKSGHTPDRKRPDYWDGDVPWISLQDATALGQLTIGDTAETIGALGLANSSARMLPARTVVLQRTANIGLCSIMEREMCTSQHFANWVCGPDLLPEYLQQVFRHMQREWTRLEAGSVLPDIYMTTFKRLQILLPPIAEQEKIAEIGAAFDRRIECERKVLVELEATRAALAQELLSGRLRLPEAMVARFENAPITVNA